MRGSKNMRLVGPYRARQENARREKARQEKDRQEKVRQEASRDSNGDESYPQVEKKYAVTECICHVCARSNHKAAWETDHNNLYESASGFTVLDIQENTGARVSRLLMCTRCFARFRDYLEEERKRQDYYKRRYEYAWLRKEDGGTP